MNTMSPVRLHLLRAYYLLIFVGLSIQHVPRLGSAATLPFADGVILAMLLGLAGLCLFGVFQPIRMIPVLLFELGWKLLWSVSVALPLWQGGALDGRALNTFYACLWAVPIFVLLPWPIVARALTGKATSWQS